MIGGAMKRSTSLLLLLLLITACADRTGAGPVVAEQRREVPVFDATTVLDGRTVVVTHPTARVLQRMQLFVERGMLATDDLRVVGLFHADEWRDYADSENELARASAPWMHLMRLDCSIDRAALFENNACTSVFENLARQAAGLVFTGGADLPPRWYGEKTALTTVIRTPVRQAWEVSLLYHLLGRGNNAAPVPLLEAYPKLPVLAICMGMQASNVATGGTLIQDIPSELYGIATLEDGLAQAPEYVHRSFHRLLNPAPDVGWAVLHPIVLEGESPLRSLAPEDGTPVQVLSAHHQAAEKIGHGLRVAARSVDGLVVEALVHEQFDRFLGVQFHPDYLVLWDAATPFAVTEGDATKNFAARAMQDDAASAAFNRGIWQKFSEWVSEAR
jgi:putative glutamine amidotransferase